MHEPDDFRPDNPPSNPELLAFLAEEFVESEHDMRELFRLIMRSNTYQQSSIPLSDHPEAGKLFAHYHVHRLEAEVLIDAICQLSGATESYQSMVPEPFKNQRTVGDPGNLPGNPVPGSNGSRNQRGGYGADLIWVLINSKEFLYKH